MPKITYIDSSNEERTVDAKVGDSLMETALVNDVPGIDADCGGACACATCHVYIAEQWVDKIVKAEDIEEDMLSVVDGVLANSRLACQIDVSEDMDGLVVTTPESQYQVSAFLKSRLVVGERLNAYQITIIGFDKKLNRPTTDNTILNGVMITLT